VEQLSGRNAVITGGGSGIGEALALACADAGMNVAVADIEMARAEAVADAVRGRGQRALAARVDVTEADSVEALAERVEAELGGCHLLCNNAGVLVVGASWERSEKDWDWVLSVNVKGVANGVRAFVPRMLERGEGGHIVNTASSTALFGLPRNGLYAASKFAVLGLTESLRMELADRGIGVSAVCPGNVRTDILKSDRNRPSHLGQSKVTRDDVMVLMAAGDEANRGLVEPARVAQLVLEAVRRNELYIITHPGSKPTVEQRCREILAAYDTARERGPDLP